MLHPKPEKALRAYYASTTRTLDEAAHAAHEIAAAEHLPIDVATADPEQWHREAILKTVRVYGRRGRHKEILPAGVRLENGLARAQAGEWAKLEVKGSDFRRYLDWLHSIW